MVPLLPLATLHHDLADPVWHQPTLLVGCITRVISHTLPSSSSAKVFLFLKHSSDIFATTIPLTTLLSQRAFLSSWSSNLPHWVSRVKHEFWFFRERGHPVLAAVFSCGTLVVFSRQHLESSHTSLSFSASFSSSYHSRTSLALRFIALLFWPLREVTQTQQVRKVWALPLLGVQ